MDVREKTVTGMAEYIEREVVINRIKEYTLDVYDIDLDDAKQFGGNSRIENYCEGLYEATELIDDIPAADAAHVRHGRWLHTEEPLGCKDVDCMECSACHDSWIIEEDYCFDDMPLWNYCPSCGAKMDGGED